jgi:MFS family permease
MPATSSQTSLNWLNFFVAALQTGFGPFIPVFLAGAGWGPQEIGFALSVGSFTAMASQLPAGALVDAMHDKRLAAGLAILGVGASALLLAVWPSHAAVLVAEALHGFASCIITPAIASMTLAIVGHGAFGERVGTNTRYAAIGAAAAALLLGGAGWWIADRGPLLMTALLTIPTLGAVASVRVLRPRQTPRDDEHPACLHPRVRRESGARIWRVFTEHGLIAFLACAALYAVADAAILPFALTRLHRPNGDGGSFVVAAAIIIPQLVSAAIAPWLGRIAQSRGRRTVLLLGFAALPLRGLLVAILPGVAPLLAVQSLDGISGAVFGVMIPLLAADLTRRHGGLNVTMAAMSLAIGLGATASTSFAGVIVQRLGTEAALLALAGCGLCAVALLWWVMPETRPAPGEAVAQPA